MKKNEKVAVFLKIFLIRYDKTEMKAFTNVLADW